MAPILMPELPDITVYVEALERRVVGERLDAVRIPAPFLLRTFDPPPDSALGKTVREIRRIGKRIALGLDDEFWLVLHLMIAGRLHWKPRGAKLSGKYHLAAFDFPNGTLLLTEAGSKRRAALYVLRGADALAAQDPGGLEVLPATLDQFEAVLRRRNHTLKRALTDPHLFSGIGNAYSDEILHRARLSPLALSQKIAGEEVERVFLAVRDVLSEWTETLRAEAGEGFPEKVTAFRPGMAVHGRFGEPCPVCRAIVQRIRYADNETNYCPRCQTGGRILADRSLSRLLKDDWPRHLDEL
jgi:formamidopyrimidine-DNA glycosylase